MSKEIIKGYVTIIVFPGRGYEVLGRSPATPEVSEDELLPVLTAWTQGHAPLIQKPTGYRLEYWMEESLHYQWYEGEELLEGEGTEPELEPVDETEEARLARLKAERAEAVSKITVTVDGMTFDGDETSQERMSRTITAAVATGEDMTATTTWVLADNTIAQPTIQQLAQALRLAGERQTELWTLPYTETE